MDNTVIQRQALAQMGNGWVTSLGPFPRRVMLPLIERGIVQQLVADPVLVQFWLGRAPKAPVYLYRRVREFPEVRA